MWNRLPAEFEAQCMGAGARGDSPGGGAARKVRMHLAPDSIGRTVPPHACAHAKKIFAFPLKTVRERGIVWGRQKNKHF